MVDWRACSMGAWIAAVVVNDTDIWTNETGIVSNRHINNYA